MLKYLFIVLSLFMLSGCGTWEGKKVAPAAAPDTIATVDSLAFLSDTAK
jgi:uncharacterized protein YcfL